MVEVILDAFKDSIKIFVFIWVTYIILSFFESKLVNKLRKGNETPPFFGALYGLIPQCGVSVIAADLYTKSYLSIGTLVALFLACSDEGIIILLTSDKAIMAIPLIILKLIVGFVIGASLDLLLKKKKEKKVNIKKDEIVSDIQCNCAYCVSEEEEVTSFDLHLWYPFIRSLKIISLVLVMNIIFGGIVYFIGENNIIAFLEMNKYLTPLFATIIGLIPNCASSVIITNLYVNSAISFGALVSGLLVNAGMGLLIIFKRKDLFKDNLIVLCSLIGSSIIFGFLICLIFGF